jgi:hypothetical protein
MPYHKKESLIKEEIYHPIREKPGVSDERATSNWKLEAGS